MKRMLSYLSTACRSEMGGVTPILLIMASIMLISGMAFVSVGTFQVTTINKSMAHVQAKYYAEGAARKALWRIGRTDPDTWFTWTTFSDSTSSASFDTTNNVLTVIGQYGGVSDTIRVALTLDPVLATEITHVTAYEMIYTAGGAGTLTYPEGYAPYKVDQVPVLDTNFYRDNANYTYTGNQVFNSPLPAGIHFVNGDVEVKSGTSLTGTLVATGTIKFQGQVTITAQQVPSTSPFYPAYYPAVASLDTTAVTAVEGGNQNLTINGLLYARGKVDLNPASITGVIISKAVELQGAYSVTYASQYAPPPPGLVLWPSSYNPSISSWNE